MRPRVKKERIISILLLLALPASGKSELRKFLLQLQKSKPEAYRSLRLGKLAELDDYWYVELMRLIDFVLVKMGLAPIFYQSVGGVFTNQREWYTLIHLINEDFDNITKPRPEQITRYEIMEDLFERIDRAGLNAGIEPRLSVLSDVEQKALINAILDEVDEPGMDAAKRLIKEPCFWRVETLDGVTVVIEFSRGVPQGSTLPAEEPDGYRNSLKELSPEILTAASVLYIWVTLEDSIRKDKERVTGGGKSDIVHGLPDEVRKRNYWGDDFMHMCRGGSAIVVLKAKTLYSLRYSLPVFVFNNCGLGCTDPFRRSPETWTDEEQNEALQRLYLAFGS